MRARPRVELARRKGLVRALKKGHRRSVRRARGIYVEVLIHSSMDELWRLTQEPALHPRWDLRFSRITPHPATDGDPVRFVYERALPGHVIRGTGISIGEKTRDDGVRTSALRFTTRDRLSPLRDGRGYWRYVPTADGVRFMTGYDYVPGFGPIPDLLLRPLIRWMTAWSFDRLRIWAESDTPPERWPLHSALRVWRPDRPRARRCRTRPPARGTFAEAPADLDTLAAP